MDLGMQEVMTNTALVMVKDGQEMIDAKLTPTRCQHRKVTRTKKKYWCSQTPMLYESYCKEHIKLHGGVTNEFNKEKSGKK